MSQMVVWNHPVRIFLFLIVACLVHDAVRRRDIWPSLPASLMAIMATVKMHPHVRLAMHCIMCEIVVSRFTSQRCLLEAEALSEGVWSEIRGKNAGSRAAPSNWNTILTPKPKIREYFSLENLFLRSPAFRSFYRKVGKNKGSAEAQSYLVYYSITLFHVRYLSDILSIRIIAYKIINYIKIYNTYRFYLFRII